MKRYLLAHDLGTSGNKATLFTLDGELVDSKWWKALKPVFDECYQRLEPVFHRM